METADTEPLLSSSNEYKQACGALGLGGGPSPPSTENKDSVFPLSRDVSSEMSDLSSDGDQNIIDATDDNAINYERLTNEQMTTPTNVVLLTDDNLEPIDLNLEQSTPQPARSSSGAINALRSLVRDRSTETEAAAPSGQFTASTVTDLYPVASTSSDDQDCSAFGSDDITVLRACVFIEDAVEYRSIHHRLDKRSLGFYRVYYSKPIQWVLYFIIATLHLLAFIESPSSLTSTSDLREQTKRIVLPCGATESIEIFCLLVLLADMICKSCLKGKSQFMKSKWLWASGILLVFSILDWTVSVASLCTQTVRARRMVRPFFLLQNSSLMKKTVNCLRKTIPHVVSVLLLLFLHLYFFTLFGMLLFPKHHTTSQSAEYFKDPITAFMSLLVLLTTANNPDVTMPAYSAHRLYSVFFIIFLIIGLYCLMNMLTAVIYNQFRGYFSDSIQASLFRRRLAIKAAFEVLRKRQVALKYSSSFETLSHGVSLDCLLQVLTKAKIPRKYRRAIDKEITELPGRLLNYKQVQNIFAVLDSDVKKKSKPDLSEKHGRFCVWLQKAVVHKAFTIFGCVVAGANVLCITLELFLEYDDIRNSRNTYLGLFNLLFVMFFCVEQTLKVWAMGWKRYAWDPGNIVDGVITALLMIAEGVYVTMYGVPYWGKDHIVNKGLSLWDLVRIINILIMIRLLRMIISQIKAMSIVSTTLFDLVKNLRAFAGILVVIYYSYALLGMELFQGVIKYNNDTGIGVNYTDIDANNTLKCGTYEQLQYWANNFDDFAASLTVLWDVMVVNNWHVFLHAYTAATNSWSQVYFIVWWLLSVVIGLNLFTALILENFIMRWDRQLRSQPLPQSENFTTSAEESFAVNNFTVHDMFRGNLQEPSEESLSVELRHHPHFQQVS